MRFRLSLRTRFVAAVFALVFLVCGGFYYAVYQFVEVLEAQLMENAVKRELHELADSIRAGRDAPLHHSAGMRGFVWKSGEDAPEGLPLPMQMWSSGTLDEVEIDHREFYGGRENVEDIAVFMLLDLAEIEALEVRLINIAYAVIVSALIAAVLVGYLLSRLVMKPVTRLAEQVSALRPDGERIRLRDHVEDHEIGLIADSIDRYQDRIGQFVARERDFTDDASHELRTPLAVILSALPLLKKESGLQATAHQRLDRIGRAAKQMHAMIEALLFLAREDGGWRAEPCALEEVIEDLAHTWRRTAEDKGLKLICDIAVSKVIAAPPGMAASVIGNLLANAVQHTQQGHVRIELRDDCILVEDTGPGISPTDRARIFERRYRGERSTGTGIGLYLVHRVCERLGWSIDVETAPNQGARFRIRFDAAELTKT